MKIEINAYDLQKFLKKSKGLYLNKLDLDLQKGLLVQATDKITLIRNNLKVQLESVVDGDVIEPGQVLIPGPTLKILENFKSDDLIITDKSISYKTKKIQYVNNLVEDFSIIENVIDYKLFEVSESELFHLLEVNYATFNDNIRPALQGIQIRDNRFIALNGYYASVREGNFRIDNQIILSQSVWKLLLKVIAKKSDELIKVFWNSKNLIKFKFKDFIIKGNLLNANFLDINNIILNYYNTKITLNPNKFIKSLKLMDKLTKEEQLIILSFIDKKLEIETKTANNIMTDEIEIDSFEGNAIRIAFDIKYLLAVINQYKDETVDIELTGRVNPMVLKHENKLDFVLPVRLKEDF